MTYMVCDYGVIRQATQEEALEFEALASASLTPSVPQQVTAFQAKAALANANLYTSVNQYMTTTASQIDQLAWQEQVTFNRNDTIIANLSPALGITSEQLDSLFIAAADINP